VNGEEIELDLLETDGVWAVVEIRRDITWSSVPANVRAAAGEVSPARVIEKQADGQLDRLRAVRGGKTGRALTGGDVEARRGQGPYRALAALIRVRA